MYSMQRPGIAPDLVYTVNWAPNTLALFHNRGTLHSITGAFEKDEVRAFWQVRRCSVPSFLAPFPSTFLLFCGN
jgi:alpha-ketoglutarate-dependent taurine dioxygenase